MGSFFSCPSKVAQLLLSIFALYKTRESVPNFCSQFLGLNAQIMKNVPVGISESFARLRFSFPVAGFFGGRLRPDKEAQVPENSLKQFRQPKPQILISCGWLFGGQLRPDKGTQGVETNFPARNPTFSFLVPGYFCCGQIVGRKSFKNP